MNIFVSGILSSLIACSFTAFGSFLVFFKKKYKKEDINFMLNMAAGVMLSASVFSLLYPSVGMIMSLTYNRYVGALYFVSSISLGAVLLWLLNFLIPHKHNITHEENRVISMKSALLFIAAITLHKLPEGLAIGVSQGARDFVNPDSLVLGIALQNIPEGLAMSIALIACNISKTKAVLISSAIGFVQLFGAIIGMLFVNINQIFIPLGMALAGGTMLFVVINEMLPETYGGERNRKSSFAFFIGFVFLAFVAMAINN